MVVTPDETILWQYGWMNLNATILYTWLVMAILVIGSWLITRNLKSGTEISRWQSALEIIVIFVRNQIREVAHEKPDQYLPFIGTLFLFIVTANLLDFIPGYTAPTGSLSTTAALAIMVFFAVPIFGIAHVGVGGYFRQYIKPTPFMLPFTVIGELSRTLALAIRLFGNMMSGRMIIGILLIVTPLFFPLIMNALGLLIGFIQAYIFTILAMVYIAAATRTQKETENRVNEQQEGES